MLMNEIGGVPVVRLKREPGWPAIVLDEDANRVKVRDYFRELS